MRKKAKVIQLRGQEISIGEEFKISGKVSPKLAKLKTEVLTEEGKIELFQDILDALNVLVLGRIEEGKNVVLTGLSAGTYKLWIEKEDGTKVLHSEVTV